MRFLIIILLFLEINTYSQNSSTDTKAVLVDMLLDSLVINPTSFFNRDDTNWRILCNNLQHVDVRGFNRFFEKSKHKKPGRYWYDELHPTGKVFKQITKTYVAIINDNIPVDKRVFSVIDDYKKTVNH